jgi:putative flippase GtrA
MHASGLLRRWLAFNAVGALGVVLQLGLVALLVHAAGLHYLVATIIAVEATIVHNFVWHQRWTWKDREARSHGHLLARLARFNLLNGGISLAGNALVVLLLTGGAGIDPVPASVVAIVLCSVANFVASERLVFRVARTGAAMLLVALALPPTAWAGPGAEALKAWNAYAAKVDGRFAASGESEAGSFFVLDGVSKAAGWRESAKQGLVPMAEIEAPSVAGGKIHHWVGAVFVPGATVQQVVERLQRGAGREADFYDDVLASRLLSREGDRLSVFMKLRRESIITVTYNTEHDVQYRRLNGQRATSRSAARKIAELAHAGTPREQEKADGDDHGFLWRLNAYWRYEQVNGGVYIEVESVSLSRSIPLLLRPFVTGTVDRIARESLEKTLRSVRAFLLK